MDYVKDVGNIFNYKMIMHIIIINDLKYMFLKLGHGVLPFRCRDEVEVGYGWE